MLIRSLTALLLLLSAGTGRAGEAELPAESSRFHLFVLAGQSNMAGRGPVEASDRKTDARILMFNKDGIWVPAVDPLHFDKPAVVGVGPGRAFASAYADRHPGITVGLIPCAVGGSPIAAWEPEGYHRQTQSHPWDDTVKRVKAARPHGDLKGVLWHQGESDSTPELAPRYEQRLHRLIQRFRSQFARPRLPFMAGQMGRFRERPWTDAKMLVDQVHRTLPASVNRTAFVGSTGLQHKGDEVHFDTPSARELGRRYFEAYDAIVLTPASAKSGF